MARGPYTVENQRPRRTVNVLGTILAPKGHGGNAQCDLSAADVQQPGIVRLIESGRLKITREPTKAPPKALPAPPAEELPEIVDPPVVDTKDSATDQSGEAVPPQGPSLEDVSYAWGEAELFMLNADDQKVICRSRGLKVGGKEGTRVARILSAQEGA